MKKSPVSRGSWTEALVALRGLLERADELHLNVAERRSLDMVVTHFLPRAAFMENGLVLLRDPNAPHDPDWSPPF